VPTLTPGPNQITAGQDAWTLVNYELRHTVDFLGSPVTAQQYDGSPMWYEFLYMGFECDTGKTLVDLLLGQQAGLTYMHHRPGYENAFVRDQQGETYRIKLVGACWLATTLPPDRRGFTLYFAGLPPFTPTLSLAFP
jgi:hypothetical protein